MYSVCTRGKGRPLKFQRFCFSLFCQRLYSVWVSWGMCICIFLGEVVVIFHTSHANCDVERWRFVGLLVNSFQCNDVGIGYQGLTLDIYWAKWFRSTLLCQFFYFIVEYWNWHDISVVFFSFRKKKKTSDPHCCDVRIIYQGWHWIHSEQNGLDSLDYDKMLYNLLNFESGMILVLYFSHSKKWKKVDPHYHNNVTLLEYFSKWDLWNFTNIFPDISLLEKLMSCHRSADGIFQ